MGLKHYKAVTYILECQGQALSAGSKQCMLQQLHLHSREPSIGIVNRLEVLHGTVATY